MQLETPRLIIREFIMEDWQEVHRYASNPKVTEHMIWGPNNEEETKAYVNQQIKKQTEIDRSDFEFGVILKETNHLIGGCGIYINKHNAEIGYCFHHEYWGNGYASEAAKALLKSAFVGLNLHRVFATCRPDNHASANVLKRIGMNKEGHLREHLWSKGKYHDSYLFSILENEYKDIRASEVEDDPSNIRIK